MSKSAKRTDGRQSRVKGCFGFGCRVWCAMRRTRR
jgi:hypothetical protein